MHARIGTFQVPPEALDDMLRLQRGSILPAARDAAGFSGFLSLVDRDSGKVLAVTLWDSEEAMRSSDERAKEFQSVTATQTQGAVVKVERFEVSIVELPGDGAEIK
jgi:heme-degrading monooxygenase HmoA